MCVCGGGSSGGVVIALARKYENLSSNIQHQLEEPGMPRLPAKLVLEAGDRQIPRPHSVAQPTSKSFTS